MKEVFVLFFYSVIILLAVVVVVYNAARVRSSVATRQVFVVIMQHRRVCPGATVFVSSHGKTIIME